MLAATLIVLSYTLAFAAVRLHSRRPFPSSFADLVLVGAGLFHVFPEVIRLVLHVPPGVYRESLPGSAIDEWAIVVALALTAFASGILLSRAVLPARPEIGRIPVAVDRRTERTFLTLLLIVSIPAAGGAIMGAGFSQFGEDNYFIGGIISSTFLPLAISVAVIAKLQSRGNLVIFLSLLLVALFTGSRSFVGWSLLAWVTVVRMFGGAVRATHLVIALVAVATLIVAISTARERVGRWSEGAALTDRLSYFREAAITNEVRYQSPDYIYVEFVNRVDGNGYGALVLQAQRAFQRSPMGWASLWETGKIVVPSFLWPSKLQTESGGRNQEADSVQHFGLEPADYLPTWLGSLTGLLGAFPAIIGAGILGVGLGLADQMRWRRHVAVPTAVTLALSILCFEAGIENLMLSMRTCIFVSALSTLLWVLAQLVNAWTNRDNAAPRRACTGRVGSTVA